MTNLDPKGAEHLILQKGAYGLSKWAWVNEKEYISEKVLGDWEILRMDR